MSHGADIRVQAFGDDALGDLDSVGVAAAISEGSISAREAVEAAIARIEKVEPHLNGVVHASWDTALRDADLHDRTGTPDGVFAGVPTLIRHPSPPDRSRETSGVVAREFRSAREKVLDSPALRNPLASTPKPSRRHSGTLSRALRNPLAGTPEPSREGQR